MSNRTTSNREYSAEDCLDALRRVAADLDAPYVSGDKYDEHSTPDEPSAKTIQTRLDGWRRAHKAAGCCPSSSTAYQYVWTHGPVTGSDIDAMLDWDMGRLRTNDVAPAIRRLDFSPSADSEAANLTTTVYYIPTRHPLKRAVITYLEHEPGLWTNGQRYTRHFLLRQFAGVRKQVVGKAVDEFFETLDDAESDRIDTAMIPANKIGRDECLDALGRVRETYDCRQLTIEDYRERRADDDPAVETIIRRLGGWNSAKATLEDERGVTTRTSQYSRTEILDALERVGRELGDEPTVSEYRAHATDDEPSYKMIWETFGGITEAREALAQRSD